MLKKILLGAAIAGVMVSGSLQAQQAEINIAGALQYSVILYPYNWDPSTYVSPGISSNNPTFLETCTGSTPCPPYNPYYGHNIIYGGWGNGVIHGYALGESIYGAERTPLYAYLIGLAVIQSVIALAATHVTRSLVRRSPDLSAVRLVGAGITGIGLAILMQQIIPGA